MKIDFSGQVAIVTGAGGGIGRAVSLALSAWTCARELSDVVGGHGAVWSTYWTCRRCDLRSGIARRRRRHARQD